MQSYEKYYIKYLTSSLFDEKWGIICTTVGFQEIDPRSTYPILGHPQSYLFSKEQGRILNEYQLVYITSGSGYFKSASCKRCKIAAGTMIMLYPNEWHSYYPDPETGWKEFWVGFKGRNIEDIVSNRFVSVDKPIFNIGISQTIINFYQDMILYAKQEMFSYQQLISSITLHILGTVYYKNNNKNYIENSTSDKIKQAKALIRKEISNPLPPEEIANKLNVSYSWFRKKFKEYTGIAPIQYQQQVRLIRAKELLSRTNMSISEISFELGFESTSQFSTFFKKQEGVSASEFRNGGFEEDI